MLAVRDRLDQLGDTVEVVLITFTDPVYAARYVERHALELPVLLDPDRSVYRAYGLGRGSMARIWSPRVLRQYFRIIRRDGVRDLRPATEDTRQLGGDFVIDPHGVLTYGFWGVGPDERPSAAEIIAEARRASSGGLSPGGSGAATD